MAGVLTGFAVLATIVLLGYVAARTGVLPRAGEETLARLVFYLASPALLFLTLLDAPLSTTFSALLLGIAVSSVAMALLYVVVSSLLWRRTVGERVIGALSSSYVNAGNLGIPISAYVLGDAAYVAPVLLLQLVVMAPVALFVLDVASPTRSAGRVWLGPLRNPVIGASALGLVLGALDVALPEWVLGPVTLLAGVAVPVALLVFGMSLHGSGGLGRRTLTPDVLLATGLKVVVHPTFAYVVGRWVLDLGAQELFALVVLAALPAAQNVFVFALRYRESVEAARTGVLLTTLASVPALLAVAALAS